ncbi:MAG: hypothetical protein ACRCYO_12415 [Bacteroidia bacterium]
MKSSLFFLLEFKISLGVVLFSLLLWLIFVIQVITALVLTVKDLVKKKKMEFGIIIYWCLAIITVSGFIMNGGEDEYEKFWLFQIIFVVIYFFVYLFYRKKLKQKTA